MISLGIFRVRESKNIELSEDNHAQYQSAMDFEVIEIGEKKMIPPRKVRFEAKKKERENLRFRTYLKGHADETELDKQFAELHRELFDQYDCSRCRNCCKAYHAELRNEEVVTASEYLQVDQEQFVSDYLEWKEPEQKYISKNKPCDFLQTDDRCMLDGCKPSSCEQYPYTNQPERIYSLYGVLEEVGVCPVVYEIWERLKVLYKFHEDDQR